MKKILKKPSYQCKIALKKTNSIYDFFIKKVVRKRPKRFGHCKNIKNNVNMQVEIANKSTFSFPLMTIDKEILSGIPVFTGTRVPIKSLFDWLETETLEDFLENFPSVTRLHALEVLHYAENLLLTMLNKNHENIA
ncbi:MAG: hypothetical protein RLZZ292_111 [Bacteroidota bacterium]|jgi:uncharacterized protein (DUF433 family)